MKANQMLGLGATPRATLIRTSYYPLTELGAGALHGTGAAVHKATDV